MGNNLGIRYANYKKSYNHQEAGTYTAVVKASFKDYSSDPSKTVSTTVTAYYESCYQNTLIPSFSSIGDLKTRLGETGCVTLPAWSDSYSSSSNYNSPLVCGDYELDSFTFKFSDNNSNADTAMITVQ